MGFLRCFECGDSKFYGGCFFLIHLKLKIQPIISTPGKLSVFFDNAQHGELMRFLLWLIQFLY